MSAVTASRIVGLVCGFIWVKFHNFLFFLLQFHNFWYLNCLLSLISKPDRKTQESFNQTTIYKTFLKNRTENFVTKVSIISFLSSSFLTNLNFSWSSKLKTFKAWKLPTNSFHLALNFDIAFIWKLKGALERKQADSVQSTSIKHTNWKTFFRVN